MQPPTMEPCEDDVPPPPYSETDIYSNASTHSPIPPRSGSNIQADDASIAASSSHSNIIYTPPETPRESHYNFSGGDDLATSTSAQAYFESRPVASRSAGLDVVHVITYQPNATPADFPYPRWATSHQTTEQDWHTFVNYLIPDYALSVNAQVVDRKLPVEDDLPTSESGREIAEAQLNQIKPPVVDTPQRRSFDETLSTVVEWNEGFFAPRGVGIRLDPSSPSSPRMPGGWNSSFDSVNAPQNRSPQQQQQQQGVEGSSGLGGLFAPRFGMEANSNGLRLGPISINGDRVSIGRSFHADSNGVRWGEQPAGDQTRAPPLGIHAGHGDGHSHDHWQDHRCGRGRGRGGRGHRHGARRDRSSSTSSSSSNDSASSSDSDSSLGSLPDWDDLKDAQIPVVKQSVSQWLQNSGRPVSKAEFKRVKAEIKAAKSASASGPADAAQRQEVKGMLAEWKEVKKSQKAMRKLARKEKKAQRKAKQKERRARRHAERSEHRRDRRDRRRSEREIRRGETHPPPPAPPGVAETPGAGFAGMAGIVPGFPRPHAGSPHHGPPHRGAHHHGPPHHGPVHHGPPHHGPSPFGFGPGRAGGPGFFGGMGMFGGPPFGGRGSCGRGSWGQAHHHDDADVPRGGGQAEPSGANFPGTSYPTAAQEKEAMERAERAREEAESSRQAATERAHEAQDQADMARQAALENAQQARNQAEASRQAALASAQASRDGALREAQALRDAALASAQQARERAQASRDSALRNAQASRDAALASAQQARERAQASRDAALANAQASRETAVQQAREAARGYGGGRGGSGWASLGRAYDARENAREWVRVARETAMRHAWSATSGAQAHADAAREQARHASSAYASAAAAAAAPGPGPAPATTPAPTTADHNDDIVGGQQETGVCSNSRGGGNSRSAVEKKYQVIDSLESELEAKMHDLHRVQRTLETDGVTAATAAAQTGDGDAKTQGSTQLEVERLGSEIEDLGQRIETLRLEADEEFARELAEEEEKRGGH